MKAVLLQDEILQAELLTDAEASLQVATEKAKSLIVTAKNGTGLEIPAYSVWAWDDDNTATLASALDFSITDFAGVNLNPVAAEATFELIKFGRAAGVLTGDGATAGDVYYLGETPGTITKVAPSLPAIKIIIGQAEPATPFSTGEARDLWIQPQYIG
jgi:hypothetical protein